MSEKKPRKYAVYEDDIPDLWCPFCGEQIKKNKKWIGEQITERIWKSETHEIEEGFSSDPTTYYRVIECKNQPNGRVVDLSLSYSIRELITATTKNPSS